MEPTDDAVRSLIDADAIARRTAELAAEIEADFEDSERLVTVGVLKGSVVFLADLVRRLRLPVVMDFLQTASYGDAKEPGEVRIKKDLDLSINGADVLLVEDIVDTGHTLATVIAMLEQRRPRRLRLAALLDKPARREVEVPIHYRGFEIDDLFVVGYGLDFAERWRNLPYVGVLEDD